MIPGRLIWVELWLVFYSIQPLSLARFPQPKEESRRMPEDSGRAPDTSGSPRSPGRNLLASSHLRPSSRKIRDDGAPEHKNLNLSREPRRFLYVYSTRSHSSLRSEERGVGKQGKS